jgi:hypothetical protein
MPALIDFRSDFVVITVIAATIAALASAASHVLTLPVWAMFVGWIAFFLRGLKSKGSAFEDLACVALGTSIGVVAALSIPQLVPITGPTLVVPVLIFIVALVVVALRGLPILNNLVGYFLGLVGWFAANWSPSIESLVQLFIAYIIGFAAGWVLVTMSPALAHK